MGFWQQMQTLRDRSGKLAQDLQVPFSRSLFRVKEGAKTRILPNPIIRENALIEEALSENSQIRGQNRTYTVTGVSKKYQRAFLEEQTVDYLIDDLIRCELIEVREETLTWTLTLAEKLGQQKFSLNNYA